MAHSHRNMLWTAAQVLVILALISCNQWATPSLGVAVNPAQATRLPDLSSTWGAPSPQPTALPTAVVPESSPTVVPSPTPAEPAQAELPGSQPFAMGEPAGCLPAQDPARRQLSQMLAYADSLLSLRRALRDRPMEWVWNGYTRANVPGGSGALALDVSDVQNLYQIQNMLNALQVAGFVTWLRQGKSPTGLHILAIPLLGELDPEWAPYVLAYWQSRDSLPVGDDSVMAALKLPPCDWMVQEGYAPSSGADWWPVERVQIPNYAAAAESYQAANGWEAAKIAERINWLGPSEPEGASTMCGPLSWAILNDALAFPPGFGGWSTGPKAFWLADPHNNGRPWSLFPREDYVIYQFSQAMSEFDFQHWRLYPGDFLYTYSKDNGFDHMLVVTEVDEQGNVYTVTNLIQVYPTRKVTIERAVLYNTQDLNTGLIRNDWNVDGRNGRTGHAGFDVFRPAWLEKEIKQGPVLYEVQAGDTFGLVAERWKTPALEIAQTNQRTLNQPLAVGELLIIPPRLESVYTVP